MSTFVSALGTIGGALGAHATGGQEAVTQFLSRLSQQQMAEADRDFKREETLRDRQFTLSRDRKQQQHERELATLRDTQGEGKADAQMAQALYLAGQGDPHQRAALTERLVAGFPAQEDEIRAFKWDDPQLGSAFLLPLVTSTGRQGAQNLVDTTASQTEAAGEEYTTLTGTPAPSGGVSQLELGQLRQAHNTTANKLNVIQGDGRALSERLDRISEMPAPEQLLALEPMLADLGKAAIPLASVDSGGQFTGPAGPLAAAKEGLVAYHDQLVTRTKEMKRSASVAEASKHDFRTGLNGWLAMSDKFGGGLADEGLFRSALEGVQPKLDVLDESLAILRDEDREQLEELGLLSDASLVALTGKLGTDDSTDPLTATKLVEQYRAARQAGDAAEIQALDRQVAALARMDPNIVRQGLARQAYAIEQTGAASRFLLGFRTDAVGQLDLGIGPDEMLSRFGEPAGQGQQKWDDDLSTAKMLAAPDIQDRLADKLAAYIRGGDLDDAQKIAFERLKRLTGGPLKPYLTPEARRTLREKVAARFVNHRTTGHGVYGGIIPVEIGYDDSFVRQLVDMGHETSYRTLLDPEEREQHREQLMAQVYVDRGVDPVDARTSLNTARAIARTNANQPGAEPDDGTQATLRDLTGIFSTLAPNYHPGNWQSGGKLYNQFIGNEPLPPRLSGANFGGSYPGFGGLPDDAHAVRREQARKLSELDALISLDVTPLYGTGRGQDAAILEHMQTYLQTLSLPEALALIDGELPIERFGLDPASLDTVSAQRAEATVIINGARPDLGRLRGELDEIRDAKEHLATILPDLASFPVADKVPGIGTEFAVMDEMLVEERLSRLGEDEGILQAEIDAATNVAAVGYATDMIATLFGHGEFPVSAADLDKTSLTSRHALAVGATQDMVSLETNPFGALGTQFSKLEGELADDADYAFGEISKLMLQTHARNVSDLARGTQTSTQHKAAVSAVISRDVAGAQEEFDDFKELIRRDRAYSSADAPVGIRRYLEAGGFDSMPAQTDNDLKWRALALWSAYRRAGVSNG